MSPVAVMAFPNGQLGNDSFSASGACRRPSAYSLRLDLEGLDLGGPASPGSDVRTPVELAQGPDTSDILQQYRPNHRRVQTEKTTRSHLDDPDLHEDTFVAHLRSDCSDAQDILPRPMSLFTPGSEPRRPRPLFLSGHQTHPQHAGPSKQLLGGFASLGTAPSMYMQRDPFPAIAAEEQFSPKWYWQQTIEALACEPDRVLDLLSIQEMGLHSVNMGTTQGWQGSILRSSEVKPEDLDNPSWMTARWTQGKRKWIIAPASAAEDRAAKRAVVVSDHKTSAMAGRPQAAFSGLAGFQLRLLREEGTATQTIVLAGPSMQKKLALREATREGPVDTRTRRAETVGTVAGIAPTSREDFGLIPAQAPLVPQIPLRRTRSRPNIRYGALNHPEELSARDQQLVQSLINSGLLDASMIQPSQPKQQEQQQQQQQQHQQYPTTTFADTPSPLSQGYKRKMSSSKTPTSIGARLLGSTQVSQYSAQYTAQTRSYDDREARRRKPVSPSVPSPALLMPPLNRPGGKKQSGLGGWIKRKLSNANIANNPNGLPKGSSGLASAESSSQSDMSSTSSRLYERRGSASDENLVLNAGKAQRQHNLGAVNDRNVVLNRSNKAARTSPTQTISGQRGGTSPTKTLRRATGMVASGSPTTPGTSASGGSLSVPDPLPPRPVPESLIGMDDVPDEALTMLIPLGVGGRSINGGTLPPKRYLRVAFVPFVCCEHDRVGCVRAQRMASTKSSRSSISHHSGRGYLLGAGPAYEPPSSSHEHRASNNRRGSTVEAFRVTARVLPGRRSHNDVVDEEESSARLDALLPAVTAFPIVLAICFAGHSLEFVSEGWDALNLGDGPCEDDRNPMFRVADLIVAACTAVMDL
ncbi:unnamed protein product [Jaminaea pallidilutea]